MSDMMISGGYSNYMVSSKQMSSLKNGSDEINYAAKTSTGSKVGVSLNLSVVPTLNIEI